MMSLLSITMHQWGMVTLLRRGSRFNAEHAAAEESGGMVIGTKIVIYEKGQRNTEVGKNTVSTT